MRVVVAPDKFAGSLSATEVADAICAGLLTARPDAELVRLPVADGGPGTVDVLVAAGARTVTLPASGPTGDPLTAPVAVMGDTVFVEMAAASGLQRLPRGEREPLAATTYGTGELVRAALDLGPDRIVVGVGGSATTDGGAGMVEALGVRLLDAGGAPVARGGRGLLRLERIDGEHLDARLRAVDLVLATDVDNPLVGPNGAAAVFGPQKGATAADVLLLDSALRRFARVVEAAGGVDVTGVPGGGAGGGLAAGAVGLLGARLVPGAELLLELIGFEEALEGADLVITGEGSLDAQSLRGKAPVGVARAAMAHGVPCVALAGVVELNDLELRTAGFEEARALSSIEPDAARSMAEAAPLLQALAARLGRAWATLP